MSDKILFFLFIIIFENSFHEGPTPPTTSTPKTTPTPPDECLDDEYQCRSPDASTPGKCIKKVSHFIPIHKCFLIDLLYNSFSRNFSNNYINFRRKCVTL